MMETLVSRNPGQSGDPATGGRRVALGRLLEAVDVRDPGPEGAVGITSVEYDSRRVGNG
ncbi:MAG: hypothetical protein GF405_07945, partial [Candidatus Eisenbacteria bacterium]|nr:hypothetical protein [Candidatus Eisenbacteria bacterium]